MENKNNNRFLLEVKNLSVKAEDIQLLYNVDLNVRRGEIHVVFGPNGSGKSSLVNTIMGLPNYKVISGDIKFKGKSILDLDLSERANLGIGLAFQHSPVVEGVSLDALIRAISKNKKSVDKITEETYLKEHLSRDVNVGFSGGERKRGELLQLLAQSPELIMFDEPDSGVDVESLGLIVKIIKKLMQKDILIKDRKNSGIIVTHSGDILKGVHANIGYVMINGRIVCSGAPLDIFDHIKTNGFGQCEREAKKFKKTKKR